MKFLKIWDYISYKNIKRKDNFRICIYDKHLLTIKTNIELTTILIELIIYSIGADISLYELQ